MAPIAISASLLLTSGVALAQAEPKLATKPAATSRSMDKSTSTIPVSMTAEQHKISADHYAKFDANKDGKLSMAEVNTMPPMATDFGSLDVDKDGSLSMMEFSKHKMK